MLIDFIGNTHLLLLHLPIGILLLAVTAEWINATNLYKTPKNVRTFIWGVGSISASLALISGLILFQNGDYNALEINLHKWSAIATTIIALVSFVICFSKYRRYISWVSILIALGIVLTGHYGGTITHGKGFLLAQKEEPDAGPIFYIQDLDDAVLYSDIVQPILDDKCVSCHGANKVKGKLSLDNFENILKGGKSGKIIHETDASKSEILSRIRSELNEKGHMPPKRKRQLSDNEIEIINSWLDLGGKSGLKIHEVENNETLILAIRKLLADSEKPTSDENNIAKKLPENSLSPISKSNLSEFESLNIVALPAGDISPFLEINFVNVDSVSEKHWNAVKRFKNRITLLKLGGQAITDKHLISISEMKNLVNLHIDNTKITDEGLKSLNKLENLEYLNVNNTQVSNTGILHLKHLLKLEKIFALNTSVTENISKEMSNVFLESLQLELLESDTSRIAEY